MPYWLQMLQCYIFWSIAFYGGSFPQVSHSSLGHNFLPISPGWIGVAQTGFGPHVLYKNQVRTLWWPAQYFHFVVLKLFCYKFGGMLNTTILLEDPVATKFLANVLRCCFNICRYSSFLMRPTDAWWSIFTSTYLQQDALLKGCSLIKANVVQNFCLQLCVVLRFLYFHKIVCRGSQWHKMFGNLFLRRNQTCGGPQYL